MGSPTDLFADDQEAERAVAAGAGHWVSKMFGGSFGGVIGLPQILFDTDLWVGCFEARWGDRCEQDHECKFKQGELCKPPRVKFKAVVDVERETPDAA